MLTNKNNLPPVRRACSNCGRLGHLSSTCVSPPKAHIKVGIEIEGLWRDLEATIRASNNWHMGNCEDGSILRLDAEDAGMYACEFQTRPGSLGEAIAQLTAIYPDATNASCGMHVHVSFEQGDVTLLASEAFHTFFLQRWEAWGHAVGVKGEFWKRLRGENQYCNRGSQFRGVGVDATNHDRYRQLNFSAYREHRTVECRLLPMFRDARMAILAVENLINIYEDFLIGGHAISEVMTKISRNIPVDIGASANVNRDIICEVELPSPLAPLEIVGDFETYPECTPGHTYVPEAIFAQMNGYNGANVVVSTFIGLIDRAREAELETA